MPGTTPSQPAPSGCRTVVTVDEHEGRLRVAGVRACVGHDARFSRKEQPSPSDPCGAKEQKDAAAERASSPSAGAITASCPKNAASKRSSSQRKCRQNDPEAGPNHLPWQKSLLKESGPGATRSRSESRGRGTEARRSTTFQELSLRPFLRKSRKDRTREDSYIRMWLVHIRSTGGTYRPDGLHGWGFSFQLCSGLLC